jgi:hypothetical protein
MARGCSKIYSSSGIICAEVIDLSQDSTDKELEEEIPKVEEGKKGKVETLTVFEEEEFARPIAFKSFGFITEVDFITFKTQKHSSTEATEYQFCAYKDSEFGLG